MRDVAMTQSEAFAAVAAHKKAMSRHSPEGFDAVLRAASEEGGASAPGAAKARAMKAAQLLTAWSSGGSLQYRFWTVAEEWFDFNGGIDEIPNVTNPNIEWRIKRSPRKVWVAFHESGSMADVRATAPGPDGSVRAASEDYIEFEEKLS